jgi:hypothetical protein
MPRTQLEDELAAIAEELVARIVEAIRNASFADVAALAPTTTRAPLPQKKAAKPIGVRTRRGASERAEVGERIAETLRKTGEPMNARALASALGIAPDKLTQPLLELRDAGRVKKHGDKRATTYTLS